MAVHFSTLLAMPTSARSPINPLCRPPLTTHNWSPSTIACSPLLLPLLHACYTRTTCSALLLQCPDCTLAQPLPLPTANSAACLTHSTTVRLWLHHRSHRCCCRCYMPATRALPALRCYCSAPTALAQPLPLPTAISPTDIGCGTLALTPRSHTATPTARDSNLGSGNHDMSRLSTFAYPNDAPIHGLADIRLPVLPTDIGAAPSPLAPRPDTHDSTTLATQTPSLPANYLHASPFDARRSTRIHLAAAPFRASRT
jgi:hypothetical protein